jgi:hypothetical protein
MLFVRWGRFPWLVLLDQDDRMIARIEMSGYQREDVEAWAAKLGIPISGDWLLIYSVLEMRWWRRRR